MRYASYASVILWIAVSGCGTPFATSVGKINFKGEQQAAVIQLSDPQVYARETLINDRRGEVEYLKDLLEKSKTIAFRPQLKRDLQTLTGFVAQLQATVDVGAGRAFQRNDELQDLEFQRQRVAAEEALVRARASLQQARDELNAAQSSGTPEGGLDGDVSGGAGTAGANQPADAEQAGIPQSSTSEITLSKPSKVEDLKLGEVNAIISRLEEFKKLMDRLDNAVPVREADVQQTPQEIFRDRQAYRAELRAALADVNLDDVHDIEGNALYRMQFRATVLPGKHKDKVAVTRLTLKPPVLSREEVESLYGAWIMHINSVLNTGVKEGQADELKLIGDLNGLYELVKLRTSNGTLTKPLSIAIAAFPGTGVYVKDFWNKKVLSDSPKTETKSKSIEKTIEGAIEKIKEIMDDFESAKGLKKEAHTCPPDDVIKNLQKALGEIYYSIERQQMSVSVFLVVSRALKDKIVGDGLVGAIQKVKEEIRKNSKNLLESLEKISYDFPKCEDIWLLMQDGKDLSEYGTIYSSYFSQSDPAKLTLAYQRAIERFGKLIRNAGPPISREIAKGYSRSTARRYMDHLEVHGPMNAFFARPVEFSQRASTVQSAANAVEMALALRGALQPKGLSGISGAGYVRQAVGRIEALERAPIVVGFSDRLVGDCKILEPEVIDKPDEPDEDVLKEKDFNKNYKDKWYQYEKALDDYEDYQYRLDMRKAFCQDSSFRDVSPQVGWVFGPRLVPGKGGNRLELRQSIVNHAVSADISVPGWWPRLDIKVENAWVGNWHGDRKGQIFDSASSEVAINTMSVALPRNQADLESITSLVLKGQGHAVIQPEIWEIIPGKITVCKNSEFLDIQVKGRNLWQGSEAYLNGRPHKRILLLPDMGGLNLRFELKDLPQIPPEEKTQNNAKLVIWTRDESAEKTFRIDIAEHGSQFCGGAASFTPVSKLPPLEVTKSWFKSGDEVTLKFTDPGPLRAYASLKIFVQPFSDKGASLGPPVECATDPPVNRDKGIIEVEMKDNNVHKLTVNGSRVRFSVELSQAPNTKPLQKDAAHLPIFYTDSGDRFEITSNGEITVASESAAFEVNVTGPPVPHVRYPDMPEPPVSPAGHIMMMEAEFSLKDQAVTKIEGGKSWTWYDAQGERPGYRTTFRLKPPSGDSREAYLEKLKSGLDIALKLTTPKDPKENKRWEIRKKIKVKLK
jgi:hypothetical protein